MNKKIIPVCLYSTEKSFPQYISSIQNSSYYDEDISAIRTLLRAEFDIDTEIAHTLYKYDYDNPNNIIPNSSFENLTPPIGNNYINDWTIDYPAWDSKEKKPTLWEPTPTNYLAYIPPTIGDLIKEKEAISDLFSVDGNKRYDISFAFWGRRGRFSTFLGENIQTYHITPHIEIRVDWFDGTIFISSSILHVERQITNNTYSATYNYLLNKKRFSPSNANFARIYMIGYYIPEFENMSDYSPPTFGVDNMEMSTPLVPKKSYITLGFDATPKIDMRDGFNIKDRYLDVEEVSYELIFSASTVLDGYEHYDLYGLEPDYIDSPYGDTLYFGKDEFGKRYRTYIPFFVDFSTLGLDTGISVISASLVVTANSFQTHVNGELECSLNYGWGTASWTTYRNRAQPTTYDGMVSLYGLRSGFIYTDKLLPSWNADNEYELDITNPTKYIMHGGTEEYGGEGIRWRTAGNTIGLTLFGNNTTCSTGAYRSIYSTEGAEEKNLSPPKIKILYKKNVLSDTIEDCYIATSIPFPRTSYVKEEVQVGRTITNDVANIRYGLIYWNLNDIPVGATITSASLILNQVYASSGDTIKAYRILKNWDPKSASISYRYTSTLWDKTGGNPGTDYASSSCATIALNGALGEKEVSFSTTVVDYWVNKTHPNYGIMLRQDSTLNALHRFHSSNTKYLPNTNRPKLKVSYTYGGQSYTETFPKDIVDAPSVDIYTKALLHFDKGINESVYPTTVYDETGVYWDVYVGNGPSPEYYPKLKFGTSVIYFPGQHIYLEAPYSSDSFNPKNKEFTIDFWIKYLSSPSVFSADICFSILDIYNYSGFTFGLYRFSDNETYVSFTYYDGYTHYTNYIRTGYPFYALNWNHIALVKFYLWGTYVYIVYINGVDNGSFVLNDDFLNLGSDTQVRIGYPAQGINRGLMDEFRFSLGIPRWTRNFTPPTSPYTT